MKKQLDAVANRAADERAKGNIDEIDFNYIRTSLCTLINYYELPSKTCGSQDELAPGDESEITKDLTSQKSSSLLSKVLRVVLIIVIILALVFGVLIVIFAIKAKKQQQSLSDDEEK